MQFYLKEMVVEQAGSYRIGNLVHHSPTDIEKSRNVVVINMSLKKFFNLFSYGNWLQTPRSDLDRFGNEQVTKNTYSRVLI